MRPLCDHCGLRLAKHRRPLCSTCYNAGVARLRKRRIPEPSTELVDTGLRVDDARHELLHPDGRREPAPADVIFTFYVAESRKAGILRLLKPVARRPRRRSL